MGSLLRRYCEQENLQGNDYLFPTEDGGYLKSEKINRLLKHYLLLAELETRTLYS